MDIPTDINIDDDTPNTLSTSELTQLALQLEGLPSVYHMDILKILNKDKNLSITENSYGVHINLVNASVGSIVQLKIYLERISKIEKTICMDTH